MLKIFKYQLNFTFFFQILYWKLDAAMSVILNTEQYAILDHEAWLLQLIKLSGDDNSYKDIKESTKKLHFQELFDLRTPFLMVVYLFKNHLHR